MNHIWFLYININVSAICILRLVNKHKLARLKISDFWNANRGKCSSSSRVRRCIIRMLPSVKFLLVLLGIHNGVDKDGDTSPARPEMLHHNPITSTTSDSKNDFRGFRKIQERSCSMNPSFIWLKIGKIIFSKSI